MGQAKVYVIHENDAWVAPLRAAFAERDLPYAEWFLDEGTLNLADAPPAGVFYNRMSASSHTRDHRYAAEYTGCVLAWLERNGRRLARNIHHLLAEESHLGFVGDPAAGSFAIERMTHEPGLPGRHRG